MYKITMEPEPDMSSMKYFIAARQIQCLFRGFRQRKIMNKSLISIRDKFKLEKLKLLKDKIMSGGPVYIELKIWDSQNEDIIDIPPCVHKKFEVFTTKIKGGYFDLEDIVEKKYDSTIYLTLKISIMIDSFLIKHFGRFLYIIIRETNDHTWSSGYEEIDLFFIDSIRKGCDYFCYKSLAISEKLNYYYDIYFFGIANDIVNKVFLKIIEIYKYEHTKIKDIENLLEDNPKYRVDDNHYKTLKLTETIKYVLIKLYIKDDDIIYHPLDVIFDYIKKDKNSIKIHFDIIIKNL